MRIMLLIYILLAFSSADLPEAQYKLKMKEIDKKACKKFSKESICYNVSMKYPTTEILRSDIAQILELNIDTTKKVVFKENPYKMIADIEEEDLFGSREWESETTLELFDYFHNFTTVSTFQYDYMGGVHPNSWLKLSAYKNGNYKRLTIEDIMGSGDKSRFMDIAERAYKTYRGLLPNEPLIKDDWFENSFVLSKNFAITDKGLLFSYSPYEIKAYASGYTYFILPYYMLQGVIGKDSVIYDIVKSSNNNIKTKEFKQTIQDSGELKAKLTALTDREVRLDIDLSLYNSYRYLWVSIGLPQFRSARGVSLLNYKGLDKFSLYPAGSKIYNNNTHRAMRSRYLLVEGEKRRYKMDDLSASLIIKAPKYIDSLCIELRVTAKNRKVVELTDSLFEDQQGFRSIRLCIPVK